MFSLLLKDLISDFYFSLFPITRFIKIRTSSDICTFFYIMAKVFIYDTIIKKNRVAIDKRLSIANIR